MNYGAYRPTRTIKKPEGHVPPQKRWILSQNFGHNKDMNQEPSASIVIYSRRTPSPDHTTVNVPGAAPIYLRAAVVAGDVSKRWTPQVRAEMKL